MYFSQGSGLVGTNDADGSEGLDCLQRLAKNLVFAHKVCSDRK